MSRNREEAKNQKTKPGNQPNENPEKPDKTVNAPEEAEKAPENGAKDNVDDNTKNAGNAGDGAESKSLPEEEPAYVLSPEQFDEIKKRIDGITAERDELKNLAQRVQADFDNFRRRNSSVRSDAMDEATRTTILAVLPAFDSLELALNAAKDDNSPLAEGVKLVYRQFTDAFAKLGLTAIETVGKPFDPAFHDAIMQVKDETAAPGAVVEEFQKGYMLKDKVIRHSMVKVNE